MCILHNTIINRCPLDTNPAKAANQSQDENRRHRIRNRISRGPAANRRRPHPRNSHGAPERHPTHRATNAATQSRDLQEYHTEVVGGKLVQFSKGLGRGTHGTGEKRVSLRSNSSCTRIGRFGQGQCLDKNRQTSTISVCAKKTSLLAVHSYIADIKHQKDSICTMVIALKSDNRASCLLLALTRLGEAA